MPDAASVPSTPAAIEQRARRAMFEQLVADIRAYHLFPDAWPQELTVALSGVRATERDAWLEGNPGPVDEPVEPSWPAADYEQRMIDAAIGALGRVQPSNPTRTRPRHAVAR